MIYANNEPPNPKTKKSMNNNKTISAKTHIPHASLISNNNIIHNLPSISNRNRNRMDMSKNNPNTQTRPKHTTRILSRNPLASLSKLVPNFTFNTYKFSFPFWLTRCSSCCCHCWRVCYAWNWNFGNSGYSFGCCEVDLVHY